MMETSKSQAAWDNDALAIQNLDLLASLAAARIARRMPYKIRLHVRDRLINDIAKRCYPGMKRTRAAKALARDLEESGNRPDAAEEFRLVIELCRGNRLCWRQVADILAGWRGW